MVEEPVHSLPRRELALLAVARDGPLTSAAPDLGQPLAEVGYQACKVRPVRAEQLGIGLDAGFEDIHGGRNHSRCDGLRNG